MLKSICFLFCVTLFSSLQASESFAISQESAQYDNPTHRVLKIERVNHNLTLTTHDNVRWSIQTKACKDDVFSHWNIGDPIILYRCLSPISTHDFWLYNHKQDSFAYVNLSQEQNYAKIENKISMFRDSESLCTIKYKRSAADSLKMNSCTSRLSTTTHYHFIYHLPYLYSLVMLVPGFDEGLDTLLDWRVGDAITYGSMKSLSTGERKASCFILNIHTGEHILAYKS